MKRIAGAVLVSCCLAASVAAARAQAPADVPQDHWAYAAVNDLASKGLIKGYPPNGDFFGKRTVTRYEMAVITQRVLDRVDELLAKQAPTPQAPVGVTQEQLDEVRKLVDEFKVELTVIGTDMKKVQSDLDAVKADVASLKDQVSKQQADIEDLKKGQEATVGAVKEQSERIDKVNKTLNSHKLGGYLQSRFEGFDTGRTSAFTPTGSGKGGPAVGGPWYGFQVRRARLKLTGNLSTRTDYALQVDFPSSGPFNLKDAFINVADLPIKSVDFTAGSFLTPFGYELNYSSADRLSPERSMAFSDSNASSAIWKTSGAGGAVPLFLNQEYDIGAGFTWYPHPDEKLDSSIPGDKKTKVVVAVVNGEGFNPGGGVKNTNNGVDTVLRAQSSFFGHKLGLGISGYIGSTAVPDLTLDPAGKTFANALREFYGADLSYTTPWRTVLQGEYVAGVQETSPDRATFLAGNHVQGWYVQAAHPLTRKLEGVVKYEEYMPISQKGVTFDGLGRMDYIRKAVHAGLLYQLDAATRLRLWYERGLTPYDPSVSSGPLRGRFGFITGEIQVKY